MLQQPLWLEKIKYQFKRISGWVLLGLILVNLWALFLEISNSKRGTQFNQNVEHKLNERVNKFENDIKAKLEQLRSEKINDDQNISQINQKLSNLQNAINNFPKQDNAELSQEVSNLTISNKRISSNLNVLQTKVKKLETNIKPIYVSQSALPFRVIGIDIWNGIPKLTVKMRNDHSLMAVNDNIAGWTVTSISPDEAFTILKNKNGQFVKVNF